jgi:ABC-2 type transport system permease protein
MNLRAIFAIARKDAIDIVVNRTTLITLLSPLIVTLLYFGINKLISSNPPEILVYNPGNSGIEKLATDFLGNAKVTKATSTDEVNNAFGPDGTQKKSDYTIGLVIPDGFEKSLQDGQKPQFTLYVNGSQVPDTRAQALLGYIENYTRSVANPQSPMTLSFATINPPKPGDNSTSNLNLGAFYAITAFMVSLMVGTTLMPGLMVEEKEKKTLRVLMVSPSSWADIIIGKSSIVFTYQIILSLIVLVMMQSLTGQIPLVLLYALLGAIFALTIGIVFGAIFKTTAAAGGIASIISLFYFIPAFFVGPMGQIFGNNLVAEIAKVLPTYYIAEGVYSASQGHADWGSSLLGLSVIIGSIVIIFGIALWALRRQASVMNEI